MQSEFRIGTSRARYLANQTSRAQQYSNQPTLLQRIQPRSLPAQKPASQQTSSLSKYSYISHNSQRKVHYMWASAERNGQRSAQDLQVLKRLALSPVLGLDMEWRPTFVKGRPPNPIALIQLAGEDDIALVHVHLLRCIPQALQDILRNPDIVKVGVGIKDDIKKLEKDWNVEVVNLMDLSHLARHIDPYWDKMDQEKRAQIEEARQNQIAKAIAEGTTTALEQETLKREREEKRAQRKDEPVPNLISLARLTARYLSLHLEKGKVSRSNWEQALNENQIAYAANDASVAYDIYQHLRAIASGENSLPS